MKETGQKKSQKKSNPYFPMSAAREFLGSCALGKNGYQTSLNGFTIITSHCKQSEISPALRYLNSRGTGSRLPVSLHQAQMPVKRFDRF
jgi:hypothetical protein